MTRQKRWLCLVAVVIMCAYWLLPVNLRCTAATPQRVYLTGQGVAVRVTLRNVDIRFPTVMMPVDGSEVGWRYPCVSFEVYRDGRLLTPRFGRCGNMNGVSPRHLVRLTPGGQCSFTMPLLGYSLTPGRYRVRVYYVLGCGVPPRSPTPLTEREQSLMRCVSPCDLWTQPVTFTVRKPTLKELDELIQTLQQSNTASARQAYEILRATHDVRTVEPLARIAQSRSDARKFAILILAQMDDARAAQIVEHVLDGDVDRITIYEALCALRQHAPDAAVRVARKLLQTALSEIVVRESANVLCDSLGFQATVEEVLRRMQTAERQHRHPLSQYVAIELRHWLTVRLCPSGYIPRTSSEWRARLREHRW